MLAMRFTSTSYSRPQIDVRGSKMLTYLGIVHSQVTAQTQPQTCQIAHSTTTTSPQGGEWLPLIRIAKGGSFPPLGDQPLSPELESWLSATGAAWNPEPQQPVKRPQYQRVDTCYTPAMSRHSIEPPKRPSRTAIFDHILDRMPESHRGRSRAQTAAQKEERDPVSRAGDNIKT
ncbi:hypothetical protein BU16DRAFT_537551 [Lophium mytilinum]|uniref:Uncharacterized protein n=1 Tax=Lophium mytilinum TaxID=390894 RepID=A0A6A6QZQ0_9PEZI|nr:hypothetical protein BU16DRAFT_537551 [Lophium mytilinum]